jgi:hypothetical protein
MGLGLILAGLAVVVAGQKWTGRRNDRRDGDGGTRVAELGTD